MIDSYDLAQIECARYAPYATGRYDTGPGLHNLGTDFGNGAADRHVFQLDRHFAAYRAEKLRARRERLEKYYQTRDYDPALDHAVTRFLVHRLITEHPHAFRADTGANGFVQLHCRCSGESLQLGAARVTGTPPVDPPYASALDALACQVQEDLAVVQLSADAHGLLRAIHLCFPNHWAAADKIGKNFVDLHEPVPGMERTQRQAGALLPALVQRGPYVRFAWGLSTDARLNHHPEPPPGIAADDWRGRRFDQHDPRAWVRVERQVIWGLPEANAFVFTIRTYFNDLAEVRRDPEQRDALVRAIGSMSAATLQYKGLADYRDDLLAWLRG